MDNNTKSLETMSQKDLLEVLWRALNKSCTNGTFSIDEAFTLKIVYDKLLKSLTE